MSTHSSLVTHTTPTTHRSPLLSEFARCLLLNVSKRHMVCALDHVPDIAIAFSHHKGALTHSQHLFQHRQTHTPAHCHSPFTEEKNYHIALYSGEGIFWHRDSKGRNTNLINLFQWLIITHAYTITTSNGATLLCNTCKLPHHIGQSVGAHAQKLTPKYG